MLFICSAFCSAQNRTVQKVSIFQQAVDSLVLEKNINEDILKSLLTYHKKYRRQKGIGVFVVSIAAPFVLAGLFIEADADGSNMILSQGTGVLIALTFGIPATAIAIPLFKASKKNKTKKEELMSVLEINENTIRSLLSKRRNRLHSFNFNVGVMDTYYPIEKSIKLLHLNLGVSYALDKNILSGFVNRASGNSSVQNSNYYFTSLNLTIGRILKLSENISLEGHIGVSGVLHQYDYSYPDPNDTPYRGFSVFPGSNGNASEIYVEEIKKGFGLPLQLKSLYGVNKEISIGLNTNVDFNRYSTMSIALCVSRNF